MKQRFLLLVLGLVLVTALLAVGQTPDSRANFTQRPALSFGFGPAGSTITFKPNAPFSAVVLEHFDQTLSDGTNISRESQEMVMRDSAGRIYRGREFKRHSADRDPLTFFSVTDPVKHVQFRCIAVSKHCTTSPYRQPVNRARFPNRGHLPDVTIEDLGESNISGVQVEGERITRVVPQESAGNDRPFDTSEEIWHSKELDVDVQVKRIDPRIGIRTATLTQLNLAEPDPKFFQIPEGYTVGQLRPGVGVFAPLPQAGMPAIPSVAPAVR